MLQIDVTEDIQQQTAHHPKDSSGESAKLALERLFKPKSIALVGATERSIWSVSVFDNLSRSGFAGRIHRVKP